MQVEQRDSPRYLSGTLNAVVHILPPSPSEEISLEGTVLDMSQKGVRIKLNTAMPDDIPDSKVIINIVMPKSGLAVKIQGYIRHINDDDVCGFHYHEDHCKDEINNLLFECVRS